MILNKIKKIMKQNSKNKNYIEKNYLEIVEDSLKSNQNIELKIEKLKDYNDVERVQKELREGSIIFLNIKELRVRDISELKKSVDKLRKTCTAIDGDIVGIENEYLIITPSFAEIYRGK